MTHFPGSFIRFWTIWLTNHLWWVILLRLKEAIIVIITIIIVIIIIILQHISHISYSELPVMPQSLHHRTDCADSRHKQFHTNINTTHFFVRLPLSPHPADRSCSTATTDWSTVATLLHRKQNSTSITPAVIDHKPRNSILWCVCVVNPGGSRFNQCSSPNTETLCKSGVYQ